MKKQKILASIISIYLFVGCQGTGTPVVTLVESNPTETVTTVIMPNPTQWITPTSISPIPNSTEAITESVTPTATEIATSSVTYNTSPEGKLNTQCLEIAPSYSDSIESSGIAVLGRGVGDKQRRQETLLLDMNTGQTTEIVSQDEFQFDHAISPDRTLIAYISVIFDSNGINIYDELVIANAEGQRQITIPWGENWQAILGWTLDQRLLISYDVSDLESGDGQQFWVANLIFDPFSEDQQLLLPDFPGYLEIFPPQWEHEPGVIYEPTITRAIYPQLIPGDEEMYTLSLWDITEQKLITSLEDIYANFLVWSKTTPMPRWSPDGSQFVILGQVEVSDELVAFELYRVSRDGEVEQLTHLTSIKDIDGSNISWSPDNRYIALLLDPWGAEHEQHAAVLDVVTQEVTDYCIPVKGGQILPPIWSPDSRQFLVLGEREEHRQVILVDIVQNFAVQLAEDFDPLGWMISP